MGLSGAAVPDHRDRRFDLLALRCPASGRGMADVVAVLNREPA